ncbi:hypothetical protein [Halioglobus japonicus]|uniref:IS1/IS1595 family N-terminal zinc-binding domain-containing protein n=1 Tax=Halioglobus japonicus TaxID=930805 RepID=UPI0012F4D2C8|nr:hypothetical protein [Halioglobus japonicus]
MPDHKSDQKRDRIPPEYDGIQVNSCKNPRCKNFGVPAENSRSDPNYRVSGSKRPVRENFELTGAGSAKSARVIICKSCNESIPLKNNQAIVETIHSLSWSPDNHYCPNIECSNNISKVGLNGSTGAYVKRGRTETGSQRWKCKGCGKTFVVQRARYPATHGRKSHKYVESILHLLNGLEINRIQETTELSPPVIYHNMERAYKACLRFNREREANFKQRSGRHEELFLCTDRQAYLINWDKRKDKRNIAFRSTISADCSSGYVFPIHLSYDPRADRDFIHIESWKRGDQDYTMALRRYSQYWLDDDYQSHDTNARSPLEAYSPDALQRLRARYEDADQRDDVELPSDQLSLESMLPRKGMQFREDYVLYAHFQIIRSLLSESEKVHFFTEQESGIRAAYMSSFGDMVRNGDSDLFYVAIKDGATRDEREEATRIGRRAIRSAQRQLGRVTELEATWYLVEQTMNAHLRGEGKWKDRWALYPVPTRGEVQKRFSHMTSMEDEDIHEKARVAAHCSMLKVDNFMQFARRRSSMLERPISSPAGAGRKWYGKSPYNPYRPVQLLEILRTYFNYSPINNNKKRETPAMKIGLADGPVDLRKILLP